MADQRFEEFQDKYGTAMSDLLSKEPQYTDKIMQVRKLPNIP